MNRSRGFGLIWIIAGLAILAVACGGSDDATDDPTTTTVAPSSDDTTSTTADETTTTTAATVSGDSDSEYCERVREARASEQSPLDFSFFGKSPEEIEAQFEENLEIFAEWPAIAPPEIKEDAETMF